MRIGELARRAGVRVVTLRFYEGEGLLPPPSRGANGYRDYAPEMVRRVRFIRRGQELGFRLAELRAFLAASDRRAPLDGEVRAHARQKVAELDARVADLRRMRAAIVTLLRRRCRVPPDAVCPILAALGDVPAEGSAAGKRRRATTSRAGNQRSGE
jgi:MerR family mercuric resistance operon transcriptional regulator